MTIPDWLQLLAFVLFPAAAAVAAHAVFRRMVPPRLLIPHHDVAGFLVAIVAVLYGIVLGFLVVIVWSGFDAAQRTADIEAGSVGDAYGFALLLPAPEGPQVQRLLAEYAIAVRDREWPLMSQGIESRPARAFLIEAQNVTGAIRAPKGTSTNDALRLESLRQAEFTSLRAVWDNRRIRLNQAFTRLPNAMYIALLLGAIMVMGFVFLFGVENAVVQFTMTAIVAGCIGLLFGLIWELNAPYAGAIRISADAWNSIIELNHFSAIAK